MSSIRQGIAESNSFLYIISPESVSSQYCEAELDYALNLGKKIIPILYREVLPITRIRKEIRALNWINCTRVLGGGGDTTTKEDKETEEENEKENGKENEKENENENEKENEKENENENEKEKEKEDGEETTTNGEAPKSDEFESCFLKICDAISSNPAHVSMHTKLLVRALEWTEHSEDSSFLCSGRELQEANQWLEFALVHHINPPPITLQRMFIFASNEFSKNDTKRKEMLAAFLKKHQQGEISEQWNHRFIEGKFEPGLDSIGRKQRIEIWKYWDQASIRGLVIALTIVDFIAAVVDIILDESNAQPYNDPAHGNSSLRITLKLIRIISFSFFACELFACFLIYLHKFFYHLHLLADLFIVVVVYTCELLYFDPSPSTFSPSTSSIWLWLLMVRSWRTFRMVRVMITRLKNYNRQLKLELLHSKQIETKLRSMVNILTRELSKQEDMAHSRWQKLAMTGNANEVYGNGNGRVAGGGGGGGGGGKGYGTVEGTNRGMGGAEMDEGVESEEMTDEEGSVVEDEDEEEEADELQGNTNEEEEDTITNHFDDGSGGSAASFDPDEHTPIPHLDQSDIHHGMIGGTRDSTSLATKAGVVKNRNVSARASSILPHRSIRSNPKKRRTHSVLPQSFASPPVRNSNSHRNNRSKHHHHHYPSTDFIVMGDDDFTPKSEDATPAISRRVSITLFTIPKEQQIETARRMEKEKQAASRQQQQQQQMQQNQKPQLQIKSSTHVRSFSSSYAYAGNLSSPAQSYHHSLPPLNSHSSPSGSATSSNSSLHTSYPLPPHLVVSSPNSAEMNYSRNPLNSPSVNMLSPSGLQYYSSNDAGSGMSSPSQVRSPPSNVSGGKGGHLLLSPPLSSNMRGRFNSEPAPPPLRMTSLSNVEEKRDDQSAPTIQDLINEPISPLHPSLSPSSPITPFPTSSMTMNQVEHHSSSASASLNSSNQSSAEASASSSACASPEPPLSASFPITPTFAAPVQLPSSGMQLKQQSHPTRHSSVIEPRSATKKSSLKKNSYIGNTSSNRIHLDEAAVAAGGGGSRTRSRRSSMSGVSVSGTSVVRFHADTMRGQSKRMSFAYTVYNQPLAAVSPSLSATPQPPRQTSLSTSSSSSSSSSSSTFSSPFPISPSLHPEMAIKRGSASLSSNSSSTVPYSVTLDIDSSPNEAKSNGFMISPPNPASQSSHHAYFSSPSSTNNHNQTMEEV